MSTKNRKLAEPQAAQDIESQQVVQDAPDLAPRGPVAHVTASPSVAPELGFGKAKAVLEARIKLKRAEALIAKGEAYSLATQIESLNREFQAKLGELQRAWDKSQRKIRSIEAALDADESTLALIASGQ